MINKSLNRIYFALVTIGALSACSHAPPAMKVPQYPAFFTLEDSSLVGMTTEGDPLKLGGFSGLLFTGRDPATGDLLFRSHTDRGPNGEEVQLSKGQIGRPFVMPLFQPRWVDLRAVLATGELKIEQEILLRDPAGDPLVGRGPATNSRDGRRSDEIPVDSKNQPLPNSFWGADLESMARDAEGRYWLGDEYLPSLMLFSPEGQLIKRYYPQKTFHWREKLSITSKFGKRKSMQEVLPEIYNSRKANRGFEGIAIDGDKLYAILQSPLELPKIKSKEMVRILEFSISKEQVTAEYAYALENPAHRIGDLASRGGGRLLVLEQSSSAGPESFHRVFEINLNSASNIRAVRRFSWRPPELESAEYLQKVLFRFVEKKPVIDLVANGYSSFEKVEGISLIDQTHLAVINDNDFGIRSIDSATGKIDIDPDKKSVLGVFTIEP